MFLCYVDESGTPEVPGNTSHFVLAGIAIPISRWRDCDREIGQLMSNSGLDGVELHTAWMLRNYLEQSRIPDFTKFDWNRRRSEVVKYRTAEILRLQKLGNKQYKQAKKSYKHTDPYVHLTLDERRALIVNIAKRVASWGSARLFAECIDKRHFDPRLTQRAVSEQALEQVVSRFQQFLVNSQRGPEKQFGLVVHDNNQTVAKKHTDLMRDFHDKGTLWTSIGNIIETPMFVDSSLTRMVQVSDLCAYALRRFVENGETELFRIIFSRADKVANRTVGVRHFAGLACSCEICVSHRGILQEVDNTT